MFHRFSLTKALSLACLCALALGALAPLLEDAHAEPPYFSRFRLLNSTTQKEAAKAKLLTQKAPQPPVVSVDRTYTPPLAPGGQDEVEAPLLSMPASSITFTVEWLDETNSSVSINGLDAPTGFDFVQATALPGGLVHLHVEYVDGQQMHRHANALGQ